MRFPAFHNFLEAGNALVCAFLFSIAIACLYNLAACGAALGLAFAMLFFSGLSWRDIGRRLLAVNFFLAFLWLVTPWSTPGAIIWRHGFISITKEGMDLALLATLKANAIAGVFMALIAPISLSKLARALYRLKMPPQLVWMFLLMDRNVQLLGETWRNLGAAASLRGFRPGANLHTYKTLASMLAILILRAAERARIMREAMLLRGFNGVLPLAGKARFHAADAVFAIGLACFTGLLLCMESGIFDGN